MPPATNIGLPSACCASSLRGHASKHIPVGLASASLPPTVPGGMKRNKPSLPDLRHGSRFVALLSGERLRQGCRSRAHRDVLVGVSPERRAMKRRWLAQAKGSVA